MEKNVYVAPEAEIIAFEDADLLKLSLGDGEGDPIDIDW